MKSAWPGLSYPSVLPAGARAASNTWGGSELTSFPEVQVKPAYVLRPVLGPAVSCPCSPVIFRVANSVLVAWNGHMSLFLLCAPVWSLQPEGCNYFLTLSASSLCCSICLHMVKDTVVLISLAGIIIPSWQILPLAWSCEAKEPSLSLAVGRQRCVLVIQLCPFVSLTAEAGIQACVKTRERRKILLFWLCSQRPQFNNHQECAIPMLIFRPARASATGDMTSMAAVGLGRWVKKIVYN